MSDDIKKKSSVLKIAGIAAAVIVILIIALVLIIDVNQFRPQLESRLTSALGRSVKTGELSLKLFSGALGVNDISIADDPAFSSFPFLEAKSLKVGIELKPLIFEKEIRITEISLDQPSINLVQSSAGRWNFSSLGSGEAKGAAQAEDEEKNESSGGISAEDIVIRQLTISNGTITINRGGGREPSTYSDVDIEMKDISFASAFPFAMSAALPGGGSLSLDGKAGPVSSADLAKTPLEADIAVERFDMIKSGFVAPDAGLNAIADFEGVLTSDGKKVASKGTAQADGLQVIKGGSPADRPVSMEYAVNYDLAKKRGILENAKLSFGKAVANLSGTFRESGESMALKMKLLGKDMPVDDVKGLLPAFGVVLPKGATLEGGVLSTDISAEGPVDALTITGSADVDNTSLAGFDLAGKLAVLAELANIKSDPKTQIQTLASRVRMTTEGINVNDIKLIVPAIGELTGAGVVSPEQALDFRMKAAVKASGEVGSALKQVLGGSGGGKITIPFFVRGTASEPKFVPDVKNAAGSFLESQLSGQGDEDGEASGTRKAIGDALKGIFGE